MSESFENENIQYFTGKENSVNMRRFYNQRFLCDYQLNWYPFDIQTCFMKMEIKKFREKEREREEEEET